MIHEFLVNMHIAHLQQPLKAKNQKKNYIYF